MHAQLATEQLEIIERNCKLTGCKLESRSRVASWTRLMRMKVAIDQRSVAVRYDRSLTMCQFEGALKSLEV